MMNLNKLIIIILIALIFVSIGAFVFGVPILGIQLTVLAFVIFIMICIVSIALVKEKKVERYTIRNAQEAYEYVKEEWKKKTNEDLTYEGMIGLPGWFGRFNSEKFFGFTLYRKHNFLPLVARVQCVPKDVTFIDYPTPQQIEDPFYGFSETFKRSPVPETIDLPESKKEERANVLIKTDSKVDTLEDRMNRSFFGRKEEK